MALDKATYDRQNGFLKSIAEHLKAQGARALDSEGHCSYRAPDGKKCAVGVLIKDEFYNPYCEEATLMRHVSGVDETGDSNYEKEQNARANALDASLLKSGVEPEDFVLLDRLQNIHDLSGPEYHQSSWWEHVRNGMIRTAEDLGLDPRVIPA
jgi:hypothetical protein